MNDEPTNPPRWGPNRYLGHDENICDLCPGCADRLYRIEQLIDRLRPLIEVLEQAGPALAAIAPNSDGKPPSPFKLAMAAAKLARS